MLRLWAIVAGGIGAFALVASAHAADPARTWRPAPPPEPEYEKPEPKFRELLSGWYLRGDLGYRLNHVGSVEAPAAPVGESNTNTFTGTFGVGYKYQWFRGDVTFDVATPSRMAVNTGLAQPQYSAKISAMSLMANAYIDFGTWAGITPYIGAGVGGTQLKSTTYADTTLPASTMIESGKALNFSWAWMAGVSYQVQNDWLIDVSFRHLQMGDVPGIHNVGAPTPGATFKNLSAQDIRIGVRFLFD